MDKSCFTDKTVTPDDRMLAKALGMTYTIWKKIAEYVIGSYPSALQEWNFPGEKYGWSFRIKDKKRAIVYLLPRDQYFLTAFVFGQKATDEIMKSNISQSIKDELNAARVYAEGRGIRIAVKNDALLKDISLLIDIKLKF